MYIINTSLHSKSSDLHHVKLPSTLVPNISAVLRRIFSGYSGLYLMARRSMIEIFGTTIGYCIDSDCLKIKIWTNSNFKIVFKTQNPLTDWLGSHRNHSPDDDETSYTASSSVLDTQIENGLTNSIRLVTLTSKTHFFKCLTVPIIKQRCFCPFGNITPMLLLVAWLAILLL